MVSVRAVCTEKQRERVVSQLFRLSLTAVIREHLFLPNKQRVLKGGEGKISGFPLRN